MAEEARYYTTTPKYSKKVLKPGDADYEKCRRMNPTAHKLDRYPQEIHIPESPADVAKALARATELGVCAGVRSSGHIFHVPSLIQDGILIDCANLNREIGYDPVTQEVSFGPASRVEELAAKLKEVNRFFPHGHAPTVGSAGFMLAGGQGWFFRGWGATNQNWLTKIEMVLPDGRCVVASREEYQDLWWAARGSGQAFFAVITRFWGKTIQRSNMWEKMLKFEINQENYLDLMTWAINAGYDTPKYGTDLNITIDYREKYDPQYTGEAIPPNAKLHLTLNLQCYCETQREARTLLSAYDRQPARVQEFLLESRPVQPTNVETIFARKRQFLGNSSQEKWQINSIMNDKKVPLQVMLEKIRPCLLSLPTRTSSVFACHCDVEVDEEDACISLPQDLYISTITGWTDPKLEPKIMLPMREYYRNAFSVAVGMYITEFDINNEEANTKCISDTALAKFLTIREKYDPKGLFPTYKYFVKTHEKINRLQAQAKL